MTSEQIETIYQAYPRKVGKRTALAAIKRSLKEVDFSTLLTATKAFAASVERRRGTIKWQYVPHPTTWFNRGGWEDEPIIDIKNVTRIKAPTGKYDAKNLRNHYRA